LVALLTARLIAAQSGIERYLGRQLDHGEDLSLALWLKAWDRRTFGFEQDAASAFPRIPASLTGLSFDVVRLQGEGEVLDDAMLARVRAVDEIDFAGEDGVVDSINVAPSFERNTAVPTVSNVIHLEVSQTGGAMGDIYNVQQAGAVGRNASTPNATFNQSPTGLGGIDLNALAADLGRLRLALEAEPKSEENDIALAEVSRAALAAEEGDDLRTASHLRAAGKWAFQTANSVGVAVAAAAIKTALGL
jgi:hypothetical protein